VAALKRDRRKTARKEPLREGLASGGNAGGIYDSCFVFAERAPDATRFRQKPPTMCPSPAGYASAKSRLAGSWDTSHPGRMRERHVLPTPGWTWPPACSDACPRGGSRQGPWAECCPPRPAPHSASKIALAVELLFLAPYEGPRWASVAHSHAFIPATASITTSYHPQHAGNKEPRRPMTPGLVWRAFHTA